MTSETVTNFGTTGAAPGSTDQAAYHTSDTPNVHLLQEEYELAWNQDPDVASRIIRAESIRYNRWPGQSPDGLKHQELLPEGVKAMPYDRAPDTRIHLIDSIIMNEDAGADREPMYFEPAKVRQTILLDLEKVNAELAYDEDRPISIENEPKLYISERCQNLIRALFNWSPDQGSDSPWKDPVDALRYLFDEPLYYVDPAVPEIVGGRGW